MVYGHFGIKEIMLVIPVFELAQPVIKRKPGRVLEQGDPDCLVSRAAVYGYAVFVGIIPESALYIVRICIGQLLSKWKKQG